MRRDHTGLAAPPAWRSRSGPTPPRDRHTILATLALALVACKSDGGKRDKATGAPARDAGLIRAEDVKAERAATRASATAACAEALATRSTAGPDRGLAALLARCGVCGVSFEPLVALSRIDPDDGPGPDVPTADEALAVLDACDAVCSTRARQELFEPLRAAHDGQAPSRPWRKLAEVCPDAIGVDARTRRFARGSWFALHQVVRALWSAEAPAAFTAARAAADLEFPLPPYSEASTALALPDVDGAALAPWLPRVHLTVTDKDVRVGALPWVTADAGRLVLVPAPGDDYPGIAVPLPQLRAAVTALTAELGKTTRPANAALQPVILAPRGLPARRVAEVVAALGGGAYLGVTPRAPGAVAWSEPVGALAIELVADAPGAAAVAVPADATAQDVATALAGHVGTAAQATIRVAGRR